MSWIPMSVAMLVNGSINLVLAASQQASSGTDIYINLMTRGLEIKDPVSHIARTLSCFHTSGYREVAYPQRN